MTDPGARPYWLHWPPELFEEMQDRLERFYESGRKAFSQITRQPPLDVKETADGFVIEIDLPGVDPQKCDVSLLERTVFIRGNRDLPPLGKDERCLRAERRSGEFSREVTLPAAVKQNQTTARYRDGVLRIEVIKQDAARPHKVEVHAEEAPPA